MEQAPPRVQDVTLSPEAVALLSTHWQRILLLEVSSDDRKDRTQRFTTNLLALLGLGGRVITDGDMVEVYGGTLNAGLLVDEDGMTSLHS